MNNFCITGRLTSDPVIRYTQDGRAVASYRVAVKRGFVREGQPDTDFFQVTSFGKAAEFVGNYFGKGSMIAVSGELRLDEYTTREGEKRTQPTLYANTQDFCGDRPNNAQAGQQKAQTAQRTQTTRKPARQRQQTIEDTDFVPLDAADTGNSDLPF